MNTRSKRNQSFETEVPVKKTRRKLRYTCRSKVHNKEQNKDLTEEEECEELDLLTPPHTELDIHLNSSTNIITVDNKVANCLLFQIPKSVTFEIMSFLRSENLASLEISNHESIELVREDIGNRIHSLYKTHNIPLAQFAETKFWNNKWWLRNIITGGGVFELPDKSFETTRALLGNHTIHSPSLFMSPIVPSTSITSASAASSTSNSHLCRSSASKVLDMFKDERIFRRDLYGSGETFLENIASKFRKCGMTRDNNLGSNKYELSSVSLSGDRRINSSSSSSQYFSTSLTPRSYSLVNGNSRESNHNMSGNRRNSISVKTSPFVEAFPDSRVSHEWLQELNKWDNALHVPRDGSIEEVLMLASSGSHILLAAGVHGKLMSHLIV